MTRQNLKPFTGCNLQHYQQRSFVPDNADLIDKATVSSLYQQLTDRPIDSAHALEQFILDRSELDAAFWQTRNVIYIRMTCQTDDKDRVLAHSTFNEDIVPVFDRMSDSLNQKYLQALASYHLSSDRYHIYNRKIQQNQQIFNDQNIVLKTEEAKLAQQYQALSAAMSVSFNGQEKTMQQMQALLESPDRSLREAAWRTTFDRRLQDSDTFDSIFDQLIAIRHQIAVNANCTSYIEYKSKEYHRFDYSISDCKELHNSIENEVVPVLKAIRKHKAGQMSLSILRPWDIEFDHAGTNPLKPFSSIHQYISGMADIFECIDPEFKLQFDDMANLGLLDLESRKGKAAGAYSYPLDETRKAFIFANAVGSNADLDALAHEAAHSFHQYASVHEPILEYREPPTEFAELTAMAMELFALSHYGVFYNRQDHQRAKFLLLERTVNILVLVAMCNSFQYWLYENPGHNRLERAEKWIELHTRFMGQLEDHSGLERQRQISWQRILHLFEYPLYSIEYAIAQLGAIELWRQYQQDKSATIANYRKAMALGGSKPLPQLFQIANLTFNFSQQMISSLMKTIISKLNL